MRKTYIQIKTEDGYKLVEKEHRYKYLENRSATVMPDMSPMVSPIDRSVISTRSKYREHMKRHGVECVGNDMPTGGLKKEYKSDDSLKRELYNLWENLPQHGAR